MISNVDIYTFCITTGKKMDLRDSSITHLDILVQRSSEI